MEAVAVRRALISVFDKKGIENFARNLSKMGVEIISSGGTAKAIEAAGVKSPDTVLPQLSVTKPFANKPAPVVFDPRAREIPNLQLTGGERISWRKRSDR